MKRRRNSPGPGREPNLSRTHAPPDLLPADWQRALRRQFGRDQAFVLDNKGEEPFFSDFRVGNPQTKTSYHVAIRGLQTGDNFCSCPDYATNELGTCKHIEFVLARLERKRGAKAAFARGWRPVFSEIYLRNDAVRTVHFRAGSDCPPEVMKSAARLFDTSRGARLAALTASGNTSTASHPWIEHNPATGARSLRVPLPPPEAARQLGDTLSAIVDVLRGRGAGT